MANKSVKLGKVTLKQGGFKGVSVKYSKTEIVENVPFIVETPAQNFRRPAHEALRTKFDLLRDHIRKICCLKVDNDAVDIISISSNEETFIISAKISVLENKIFALNTPLLSEDDYHEGAQVLAIVGEIYDETLKYLNKKEKLETKQFLMEFVDRTDEAKLEKMGLSKDMNFEQMAAGDQRAKMIEALEMTGAVILDKGAITVEEPKDDDVVIPAASGTKKSQMTKVA